MSVVNAHYISDGTMFVNTQSNCGVFSYTDDSLTTDDDYADLETPVSTRNYFQAIQNLDEIQNTLGSDSGRPRVCRSFKCIIAMYRI